MVIAAFLDTSILLGGLIELGPGAESAQRIFDAIADGRLQPVATAWHCCLEFYAVSTRLPEEFRLRPEHALKLIEVGILHSFQVHDLPESARQVFLRHAASDGVVGGRLYDSHIAEIAQVSSDARVVVTENRRHFSGLLRHGVQVLTAAEFVAEAGI